MVTQQQNRGGDPREPAVWEALASVADPEIPAVSVVELGVIHSVAFGGAHGEHLRVELMPTFVGCPAIEVMRQAIGERLRDHAAEVEVAVSFAEPWTSDRITPEGRRKLRESGFAPPISMPEPGTGSLVQLLPTITLHSAECPHCGSRGTTLENAFGPTLCRAIYYCNSCRQPFEQFKSV